MFWIKGSYTIEAAVILPMVLFTVLFIMYSAFYMHNRMVLQEAAYETAIYGTTLDRKDTNRMKQKMQEKYNRSIKGRMIAMENTMVEIEVTASNITVSMQGSMHTVGIGILPNFNGTIISVKKSVTLIDPLDRIAIVKLFEMLK